MRTLLLAVSASVAFAQMPSEIKLKLGETHQFTAPACPNFHSCEWRQGAGHDGTSTLSPTGLYVAPATYHEHGKVGGCPLAPHNSAFAMPITSIAPVSNSAAMVTLANSFASVGIRPQIPTAPTNLVPPGTVEIPLTTYPGYDFPATAGPAPHSWNGNYPFLTPPWIDPTSPGAPGTVGSRSDARSRIQSGWRTSLSDNRWTGVNPSTCEVYEYYWHDDGANAPRTGVEGSYATVSGTLYDMLVPSRFDPMSFKNAIALVGSRKSSNASGIWNTPMQLDAEELARVADRDGESGTLGHVFAITLTNNAITAAVYNQTGTKKWPAISEAGGSAGADHIPYGSRIRINQSFIDSFPFDTAANTYGGFADKVRLKKMLHVIFNTMRDYGFEVMDGTYNFDSGGFHTRSVRALDPDAYAAMDVMRVMHINYNWANPWLSADVVDFASFMVSEDSNVIRNPAAQPEYVQYWDTTANAAIATTDIIVTPPTAGSLTTQYNIVAGAGPVNLAAEAWGTGLADNTLTWTATPSGTGVLASNGVYTPPATIAQPTSVTVRVALRDYPAAYSDIRVVVYPAIGTGLHIRSFCGQANSVANIVETSRTWWGKDSNGKQINPFAVGSGPAGVAPVDTVYPAAAYGCGGHGEQMGQFYVPNGSYKVTSLLSNWAPGVSGNRIQIALNGQIVAPAFSPWDMYPVNKAAFHISNTVNVTTGSLVYNINKVGPDGDYYPFLSAIVLEPIAAAPTPPRGKGGGHGKVKVSGEARIQ